MLTWIRAALDDTFWLIPSVIIAIGIGLAIGTLKFDSDVHQHYVQQLSFVYAGGADGARAVLSSIATAMMSVAGTVFSITVAALALASQQFGPRLLTSFMRDKGNQATLGVFLSTFVYSLLILRTVTGNDPGFVPHISVSVGVALAIVSCGVLVFFIHHLTMSLRASYVIEIVGRDLMDSARRLFPAVGRTGRENAPRLPEGFAEGAIPLHSLSDGYLRMIDLERLFAIARNTDSVIRIDVHPGDYIMCGDVLATVSPAAHCPAERHEKLLKAFHFGEERSRVQDIGESLNQLAEIAVRSLSSNQVPHTAKQCLDRAGSVLCYLGSRRLPATARYDGSGGLRLLANPYSYDAIVDAIFNPIRENGASNTQIMLHLVTVVLGVVSRIGHSPMLDALQRHAELTVEAALNHTDQSSDIRQLTSLVERIRHLVEERRQAVAESSA